MKILSLILLAVLLTHPISAQAPEVVGMSPAAQSLTALPTDAITLTFDQSLEEATVTADSFMVFGRWSGPMPGTFSFNGSATEVTFTPARAFFYGEWITVRLTNAIESTGGDPITHGYGYNYWIKTLPGSLDQTLVNQFSVEQAGETFIQSYGAYAGDVNDDEFTDLVVITETAEDIRVFLNDGTGDYDTFTIFDMPASNRPSTNEGADFNHDGQIDLAIGSTNNNQVSIFMGDDTNIFDPETSATSDEGIRGLTVLDVNGDGWDDIATANRNASTYSILVNDGTGDFNPAIVADAGVGSETSIAAVDLNNDGITDLAIGGFASNNVVTLINDGQGNFTNMDTTPVSGSPWMLAAGDINGDGNVDIVSCNSSNGEVSVLAGDGNGNLNLLASYPSGDFCLAIDLGDVDGDGDLDFIASNFGNADFTLYENDGAGNFVNPRTYDAVEAGSCAIFHDRNNDGAMDITLIDEIEDVIILYENTLLNSEENILSNTIIYPNPFTNQLNITTGNSTFPIVFRLYDVQSRLLYTEEITSAKTIRLPNTIGATGFYIAEIEQEGQISRKKLLKKRR
ncbi:MAG: FG-GAP-like repeat-containing protein [Bacteroidota bacterium]